MAPAAWLILPLSLGLGACMEISALSSSEGGAGPATSGGGTAGGGGVAGMAGGQSGAAGAGFGGGFPKVPLGLADFGSEHSADSSPNAAGMNFEASIPASTRLLIACAHARDNDTPSDNFGVMTIDGQPMLAIDPAARGISGDNQAGVQCFWREDPPTGSQKLSVSLLGQHSYDFLRISSFYFSRPAKIAEHSIATHASGSSHTGSLTTTEPAFVLAVYTRYHTVPVLTLGFIEIFSQAGFGSEALAHAAYAAQVVPGEASWKVSWTGTSAFGGSQLVAIVPQ